MLLMFEEIYKDHGNKYYPVLSFIEKSENNIWANYSIHTKCDSIYYFFLIFHLLF